MIVKFHHKIFNNDKTIQIVMKIYLHILCKVNSHFICSVFMYFCMCSEHRAHCYKNEIFVIYLYY